MVSDGVHLNKTCYGLTSVQDRLERKVAALNIEGKFVNMHFAGA